MPEYPIVFRLTHEIRATRFSARVVSEGMALMAKEDGEWWCHGVEPGGITEHGDEPPLAYAAFKAAFFGVLNDLADESGSFGDFERAVQAFIADTDRSEARRWELAREEIRAGKPVEAPFNDMPRVTHEVRSSATVTRLDHIEAGDEKVWLAEAA